MENPIRILDPDSDQKLVLTHDGIIFLTDPNICFNSIVMYTLYYVVNNK